MDEATRLAFEMARDVAIQLATLSTGLLGLTITFTKEIFGTAPARGRWLLSSAWVVHILSIIAGVWTLMALTGTLMPVPPAVRTLTFDNNVRVPAGIQVIAFVIGTLALVIHGILQFQARTESKAAAPAVSVPGPLVVGGSPPPTTGVPTNAVVIGLLLAGWYAYRQARQRPSRAP